MKFSIYSHSTFNLTVCDSTFRAAIVQVVYGVAEQDDPEYVAVMEKVLDVREAFTPGRYLVEFMPFLRHVPAWVPGAGFQNDFAGWRNATQWVKDNMTLKTKEGMVCNSLSLPNSPHQQM